MYPLPIFYLDCFLLKKILFIYSYREGKGEKKRGRGSSMHERNIDWLLLTHAQTGEWAHNPGMCPDQNGIHNVLFCRVLPNQLCYTSQGKLCLFLMLSFESSLSILYEAFCWLYVVYTYCLLFCSLSFHLLIRYFIDHIFLIFWKSYLSFFSVMVMLWCH